MCHGHLDPKYQMRDMEARMKGVSVPAKLPRLAPLWSLLARMLPSLMKKGQSHV